MPFLITLHGFVRGLILLAALIGLGGGFYAFYGGRPRGGTLGRVVPPIFLGFLDVQLLLGLVLLFTVPGALRRYLVHGIIMAVAVVLAHVFRVRLKKATEEGAARALLLLFAVPLIVILVGLAVRPRGM